MEIESVGRNVSLMGDYTNRNHRDVNRRSYAEQYACKPRHGW